MVKEKVKISFVGDKGYAHTTLFPMATEAFLCCRKVGKRRGKKGKRAGGWGEEKKEVRVDRWEFSFRLLRPL